MQMVDKLQIPCYYGLNQEIGMPVTALRRMDRRESK